MDGKVFICKKLTVSGKTIRYAQAIRLQVTEWIQNILFLA